MSQDDGISRRNLLQRSALVGVGAATLAAADAISAGAIAQTGTNSAQKYIRWEVKKKDQVATIRKTKVGGDGGGGNAQAEIGEIFSNLRGDNSVRVIVLVGEGDGIFGVPPYAFASPGEKPSRGSALGQASPWDGALGVVRVYEAMLAIEKPIVAKVNGDAVGLHANLIFASDFIVAREDAVLGDHHLTAVKVPHSPGPIGLDVTPGDGGAAWLPLHMTPTQAKETLMLGKTHTAKQLAEMGIINYAVPADQLDRATDDIVQRLLQRSAYALAWSKRVINQHYVDRVNKVVVSAVAYELVDLMEKARNGGKIFTELT